VPLWVNVAGSESCLVWFVVRPHIGVSLGHGLCSISARGGIQSVVNLGDVHAVESGGSHGLVFVVNVLIGQHVSGLFSVSFG